MFGGFSRNIGIDLGTANTLVYINGKGIVLKEPSVVAMNSDTNEIRAVGTEAKNMIGRTPGSIIAKRPMKDGVIADFEVTAKMIRYFINKTLKTRGIISRKPFIMICVPSGVTEVEKRAVIDAAKAAGAKEANTIEEPLAAAIGANLPVWEATGSMIVDIGGGTTEVAVISLGGIVCSRSVRIAGDEMDEAIKEYIKNVYKLMIGDRTAETLKIEIGTAIPPKKEEFMEIKGRDLVTGLPKTISISSTEVSEALSGPINNIINAVKLTLEKTPPELASDIMDRGIVLAGGGALLRNLDKLISKETGIPVLIADNPLDCVAIGTGQSLQYKTKINRQK